MHTLPDAFRAALAAEFRADFASFEPSELQEFGRDWTRVFDPAPSAIVR